MRRSLAYNLVVAFATIVLMGGFVVGFVQHAIDKNNDAVCGVVLASMQAPPAPPVDADPKTEYGRQLLDYNKKLEVYNKNVTADVQKLIKQYNCK